MPPYSVALELISGVKKIQQLERNHYSMGKLNSTSLTRYLGLSAHQVGILKSATEDGEIGFRFSNLPWLWFLKGISPVAILKNAAQATRYSDQNQQQSSKIQQDL